MDDLISKLSEIRSEYNCFDEDEEPYYRALSEAIKILSQPEDGDTISRQAAINTVSNWLRAVFGVNSNANTIGVFRELRELPSAEPVRCKDCRWGREVCGNIECFVDSNIPTEYHGYEWFCPNGERRTDE